MTRSQCLPAAAVGAASLTVAWGLSSIIGAWNPEQTILQVHLIPMAAWLRGDADRALVTYPAWGYPALLALLPVAALRVLQVVASACAAAIGWCVLSSRVGSPAIVAALFVLGVPWLALALPAWTPAPVAVLSFLALILVGVGLERGDALRCAAGGVLLGVAANFRSETLALVAMLPVAAALGAWRRWPWGRPVHAVLAGACALATLLPWAIHVQRATGHAALTASNGGMVALISLGQLPGNPWGIAHHDSFATQWLRAHGVAADPLAPDGDRALRSGFLEAIRSHPFAYARKIAWNLKNVAIGGLYVGQISVAESERLAVDSVRERWKRRIGLNPNLGESAERPDPIAAEPSRRAWLALAWQASGVMLGSLFLWTSLAGVVMARRRLTSDGVLAMFALAAGVQVAVMAALQYLPRHASWAYPMLLPFAAIALSPGLRWASALLRTGSR